MGCSTSYLVKVEVYVTKETEKAVCVSLTPKDVKGKHDQFWVPKSVVETRSLPLTTDEWPKEVWVLNENMYDKFFGDKFLKGA